MYTFNDLHCFVSESAHCKFNLFGTRDNIRKLREFKYNNKDFERVQWLKVQNCA